MILEITGECGAAVVEVLKKIHHFKSSVKRSWVWVLISIIYGKVVE